MLLCTEAFTSLCFYSFYAFACPRKYSLTSIYETIDIFSKENEKPEKRKRKQS